MRSEKRRPWLNDELVKTLALYCQIPFGKMHARNPAVIALAARIQRTPAAVALKLVNFASLDPELKGRGVGGMRNVSHVDQAVWEEFYGRWEALADQGVVEAEAGSEPRQGLGGVLAVPAGPTEVVGQAKMRRGQSFFRSAVIAAYEGRCCITGLTSLELLRASHIVPWSHNLSLRLDPRNGLCLNALHDAAFDRGLITFSDKCELLIARRLRRQVPAGVYEEMFESRVGIQIKMPERFRPSIEMLAFHRSTIFCG